MIGAYDCAASLRVSFLQTRQSAEKSTLLVEHPEDYNKGTDVRLTTLGGK